ncbi:MAG: hypothetical protein HYY76_20815 [Acidobacteria bacterium]|nr:hypothetical protein [Acidobacteriota bacterium]
MTRAWHALAAYLVITLVATWPLARGLARDVAWDLGDSILNMWILSWDIEQIRRLLGGELSRMWTFFDANIFYPVPLALAYSEHLLPQAIQILPVYLISENPILCYNLLFLSTFVLSGLGMYLLVRELTGSAAAAFVAGLLFAFAPYRLAQLSHLQLLSTQWMPFVFCGLVRYFNTRRLLPLAGAALALAAQNLSSGYYLLFFMPFPAFFVLWEVGRRRLWRDGRTWRALSGAGLLVAAVTGPFLLPYAALHSQGIASRPLGEVSRSSADVYSYATAFSEQRIWGRTLQAFPMPEGALFPGLVPVLLALIGIVFRVRDRGSGIDPIRTTDPGSRIPDAARRWLTWLLAAAAIGHAAAAALTLALRRITIDAGLFVLRMSNVNQLLLRALAALALLLVVSPATRVRLKSFMRERGFFVLGLVVAVWLSLGPAPRSLGRPVDIVAPYRILLEYVPGFDGIRVPARFAMIAAFMLAVLGGYGATALARHTTGRRALVVLSAAFLLEGTHVPLVVNGMTPLRDLNTPEPRLYPPGRAPAIYHEMARPPRDSVVVELPLGQPDYDLRAMYYSTVHWRPVVNGYSGFFPRHYGRLTVLLSEIPRHPDVSLQALRASGATHVILHEGAYRGSEGPETAAVLRQSGAVELFRDGPDVLMQLPR